MADLPFSIVPADDELISPEEERAAAVAGALAEPGAVVPEGEEAPTPLGRSWQFDFADGRFVRQGNSPAPTTGFASVQQWVLMAMYSARYAHPVFSDSFGVEDPHGPIGQMSTREVIATYEQRLREAVLVHERITSLTNFKASFDAVSGELFIEFFEIVTDEEEVIAMGDITLSTQRVQEAAG